MTQLVSLRSLSSRLMVRTGSWMLVASALGALGFTAAYCYDEGVRRIVDFIRKVVPIVYQYKKLMDTKGLTEEQAVEGLAALNRQYAPQARKIVEQMQGFYLKLAQTMVAMGQATGMMPPEYVEEFKVFMDKCPYLRFDKVRKIVEQGIGPIAEVFESFEEEPINAASIGQVHCATLKGGQEVVVKVQNPNAERLFHLDMGMFLWVTKWAAAERTRTYFTLLYTEFKKQFVVEFDYRWEAALQREALQTVRGYPGVMVPEPFDEHRKPPPPGARSLCTKSVMVMERIYGKSFTHWGEQKVREMASALGKTPDQIVSDMQSMTPEEISRMKRTMLALYVYNRARDIIRSIGSLSLCRRRNGQKPIHVRVPSLKELADTLLKVQGHLIFKGGFVNGDPHPGNLMLCDDGRVGLIDWGQAQRIPGKVLRLFARLVIAVADGDEPLMADCMRALGGRTERDLDWTHAKMAQLQLASWSDDFVNEVGDGGITKFEENVNNVDRITAVIPDVVMVMKNQMTVRGVVGMMGFPKISSAEALRPNAVEYLEGVGELLPQTQRRKVAVPPEVRASQFQDGDFDVYRGKDVFPGTNIHMMPAHDMEACKRVCRERGYGAFVLLPDPIGKAYFRTESAEVCHKEMVNHPFALLYLRMR
eukprot:CAMPEP_0179291234 /NCGR_PEP_ID=MMETSP0797-20121207/42232_1 /TAXON_ID=47934 /ORGANISM="Dinophysis acuminata, Strain DAEP01" /LENGTH=646 /DNA_ID=CAMNT_0021000303 /DNA_START=5 /DNA_END=1945 /DNA_ORIENTATION=-